MAVSYANSNAHLYDLETGKSILSLQSNETYCKYFNLILI